MKVILTFKKAPFDYDTFGYHTIADATLFGFAQVSMKCCDNLSVKIIRLVPHDSYRRCKVIFDGNDAKIAAYEWVENLGHRIDKVKVKYR